MAYRTRRRGFVTSAVAAGLVLALAAHHGSASSGPLSARAGAPCPVPAWRPCGSRPAVARRGVHGRRDRPRGIQRHGSTPPTTTATAPWTAATGRSTASTGPGRRMTRPGTPALRSRSAATERTGRPGSRTRPAPTRASATPRRNPNDVSGRHSEMPALNLSTLIPLAVIALVVYLLHRSGMQLWHALVCLLPGVVLAGTSSARTSPASCRSSAAGISERNRTNDHQPRRCGG